MDGWAAVLGKLETMGGVALISDIMVTQDQIIWNSGLNDLANWKASPFLKDSTDAQDEPQAPISPKA